MNSFLSDLLSRVTPLRVIFILFIGAVGSIVLIRNRSGDPAVTNVADRPWQAPDTTTIPHTPDGDIIRYGRKLIANTAYYLGPKGTVAQVSNPMNCQNCHLDAGAKPFGNSFAGVASIYPVFKNRSGVVESIEFRINDCMTRSMNGHSIDSAGREMRAMVAYLKWIGKDVKKGVRPDGAGLMELSYLNRAADTLKGRILYTSKCKLCHGKDGSGIANGQGGYVYPPLWGQNSYNVGAGLYRLTRFAGFIKYSMPLGATKDTPAILDEEAWDIAAFVNSQPRPEKSFPKDWPDLKKKAIDSPFGPYADNFSENQHKYGPFGPIKDSKRH